MNTRSYQIVEGSYVRDILDQPRALHDTYLHLDLPSGLSALAKDLQEGRFRRVVLTGMGSSLHGLYPLVLRLHAAGYTALQIETSELVHYMRSLIVPESLFIVVSQSGQSAEVVRLLQIINGTAPVLAITNTEDSPLAKGADVTLLTQAGPEFSVSVKTYVTALMMMEFVGAALCLSDADKTARQLGEAEALVAAYLQNWQRHVWELADHFDGIQQLFLVGRGPSLAAAGTGALILKESSRFHAEGMSSAAFRHGPMEMLSSETFVAVFDGEEQTLELNRRLLADIRSQAGRAEGIGAQTAIEALRLPPSPSMVRPILEILPVQMMTLALNARAGTEAGCFSFATKITTVE